MMESIAGNDSNKPSAQALRGWELEENVINKYEGSKCCGENRGGYRREGVATANTQCL